MSSEQFILKTYEAMLKISKEKKGKKEGRKEGRKKERKEKKRKEKKRKEKKRMKESPTFRLITHFFIN